ncbi:MAG: M48 family metalloprotease [Myxococcales bacterium]|nr:M48 family metalloprotease [Myxococcales bacterium]
MVDPVAEARAVLPGWVGWLGPALHLLVGVVAVALLSRLARAIAFRPAPADAHWTERARRGQALRSIGVFTLWVIPISFATTAPLVTGPMTLVPEALTVLLTAVACFAVGLRDHLAMMASYRPFPPRPAAWLGGAVVVVLVFMPILPLFVGLIWTAPTSPWTPTAALWATMAVALWVVAIRGHGIEAARVMRLARPAGPRLRAIVAEASREVGRPPPPTFELAWWIANAAAFPFGHRLVFTDGALDHLDDDELLAVCRHELAHLAEPRAVLALRALVSFALLPLAAIIGNAVQLGTPVLLVALASFLVLVIVSRRVQRRMEERADDHAHEGDVEVYARALARLYEINGAPAVLRGRPIHPHLYDRLVAAGATPSYPRPDPPPRARTLVAILLIAILGVLASALVPILLPSALPRMKDPTQAATLAIAFNSEPAWHLAMLAHTRWEAGSLDAAAALYEAALEIGGPREVGEAERSALVFLYARQGQCDRAQAHFDWLKKEGAPELLPGTEMMMKTCVPR